MINKKIYLSDAVIFLRRRRHLVVLWVKQFRQLVEDQLGVCDRPAEDVVDGGVEVVGGQDGVCSRKPRPHHQHGLRRLAQIPPADGRLQLPEGVMHEGQRLALHPEPGGDVVGPRRQHHVVGQQRERLGLLDGATT